ncbi:MAG: hypothetical protein VX672_10360 [Planctomycetota bacterium]|nr:hypothetical protein [Planctomycetota bacterium]
MSITAVLVACAPSIPRAPAVAVSASELASTDVPVGDSPSAIAVGEGTTETQVEGVLETDDGATRGAEVVSIVGEDGVDRTVEYVVDDLPVGLAYPVEGLVGQINGRPVFADEFLIPLESRILRIVAEMPRPQAVQQVDLLVARRFQEYLNSELIIAEAESRLSPEQQQGVLAWLTSMQEDMITSRGGTRDSATSSIEDEFGLSLEEFVSQRRSVALAQDLLRKRVSRERSCRGATSSRPTGGTTRPTTLRQTRRSAAFGCIDNDRPTKSSRRPGSSGRGRPSPRCARNCRSRTGERGWTSSFRRRGSRRPRSPPP